MPDLDSLRLLVVVDDLGSMGKAAAALGIAQPSASKRLTTLERRLGLVLVDRTRRGSALTPAGRVVCGWAKRVLGELEGMLAGAEALRLRRDAELRVAASMTIAEHLVPGWIGELRKSQPGLYVGLRVTNSANVGELMHDGEVDIGFVESPSAPGGLATKRVATDRLKVVVAPSHPLARRGSLSAEELAREGLVVREPGSGTRETLERALRRAGIAELTSLVELGSAAAVRGAVIAGTGPAVMSELAVAGDLVEGRLVAVEVTDLDLRRTFRAVWPAGRKVIGPAAALLAVAAGTR